MLQFDPAVGFTADEIEDVRAAVAAEWRAAFATSTDVPQKEGKNQLLQNKLDQKQPRQHPNFRQ